MMYWDPISRRTRSSFDSVHQPSNHMKELQDRLPTGRRCLVCNQPILYALREATFCPDGLRGVIVSASHGGGLSLERQFDRYDAAFRRLDFFDSELSQMREDLTRDCRAQQPFYTATIHAPGAPPTVVAHNVTTPTQAPKPVARRIIV